MYEYKVDIEDHLNLPEGLVLEELFPLAIGTLGDFAAELSRKYLYDSEDNPTTQEEVKFSAIVLQAYVDSKLDESLTLDLLLLASCAYYLCDMPGNAIVLLRRHSKFDTVRSDEFPASLEWVLDTPWKNEPPYPKHSLTNAITSCLFQFYRSGNLQSDVRETIRQARLDIYKHGSANQLLISDLLVAVFFSRIDRSTWSLLPDYSDILIETWKPYLSSPYSLKELWPSQKVIGTARIYSGASAVIQMPTSAGKTKATELVIRSAFLSKRTTFAVLVAPFRALCQEISIALSEAFAQDNIQINQLSDALQPDYLAELEELLGVTEINTPSVIVLTPEKLLYVLRQKPSLIEQIGLVIYDEGHQFDTGSRGVTYELLLTSIKRLLVADSQTLLISAVIQNSDVLAEWLLDDSSKVIIDKATQTHRAVAYTSWAENLGQLNFFDNVGQAQTFFVPRVLAEQNLNLSKKETKSRVFPDRKESNSIALYLGLRIVSNGGVAIFCGVKASVSKLLKNAVDIFDRGVIAPIPTEVSNALELNKLIELYKQNFGSDSYLTKAAMLGIFAHHGDTPHGLRLVVEHAMREGLIRFVVCTSTLAQGVNLPIRYLIVTGTRQGQGRIKIRDFHNLMGRAGRAGIHGEGTVIFSDPSIYDKRDDWKDGWRWQEIQSLLTPELTEPTGSSLLTLTSPLTSEDQKNSFAVSAIEVIQTLLDSRESFLNTFNDLSENLLELKFTTASLHTQLKTKCQLIDAIQSFLMANRIDNSSEDFYETCKTLATETFAYALAREENKTEFVEIFLIIAKHVEEKVPEINQQARYGRSLLGVNLSLEIDAWATDNLLNIRFCTDEDELLDVFWPLMAKLSSEKHIRETSPDNAIKELASKWISGESYESLLGFLQSKNATYPYGQKARRSFTIDQVVDLCEQGLGFSMTLILTAVTQAVSKLLENNPEELTQYEDLINLLQKRLKYGLPNQSCIAFYEAGFCERVVAQYLDSLVLVKPKTNIQVRNLISQSSSEFKKNFYQFPSYFELVFSKLSANL